MWALRVVALVLLVYAVNGKPSKTNAEDYDLQIAEPEEGIQNDYTYSDLEDEDVEPEIPEPLFVTRAQDFIAKQNETVHLPCQVENGDTLVTLWKKNGELIFHDSIKFNVGNNFRVENRSLVISNVGANETANYTCSIPLSQDEYLEVTHRLFVHTSPKIVSLRSQFDIVQLDAGKTLVLSCKAIGFPKPTMKWSHKGQRLDAEGETVTIENISNRDAGDYQCLADNNIEPPAHQFIHIAVAHAPVVRIEKLTVNAEEMTDVELSCFVRAVPKAEVVWQKDGINIQPGERRTLRNFNHTHLLQIRKLERSDFGVYTCYAGNRVGKTVENVTLTMYPSPAKLANAAHKTNRNELTWTLESKAPITDYVVEYKKTSSSEWSQALPNPEVTNPDGNTYTVKYNFTVPHGHYEARLRSKNTYGWSDWSDVVKFKSGGHHHHHHTPEVLIPEQSTLQEELIYHRSGTDDELLNNEILVNVPPEQPPLIQTTQASGDDSQAPKEAKERPFFYAEGLNQTVKEEATDVTEQTQLSPPLQEPQTQTKKEVSTEPNLINQQSQQNSQEQPQQAVTQEQIKESASESQIQQQQLEAVEEGPTTPSGVEAPVPGLLLLCAAFLSLLYSR